MLLQRACEFKLLPTPAQAETFERWLDIYSGIGNFAPAERQVSGVRVHACPACGYSAARNVAAAEVVLQRGAISASGLGAREARQGDAP